MHFIGRVVEQEEKQADLSAGLDEIIPLGAEQRFRQVELVVGLLRLREWKIGAWMRNSFASGSSSMVNSIHSRIFGWDSRYFAFTALRLRTLRFLLSVIVQSFQKNQCSFRREKKGKSRTGERNQKPGAGRINVSRRPAVTRRTLPDRTPAATGRHQHEARHRPWRSSRPRRTPCRSSDPGRR